MRFPSMALAVAVLALGVVMPHSSARAEAEGLTRFCLQLKSEDIQRTIRHFVEAAAEQFEPALQDALKAEGLDANALSDKEKQSLLLPLRDRVEMAMPTLLTTFCALYDQGSLPGLGPGILHGSLLVRLDLQFSVQNGYLTLDAGDCEQSYWVTVEPDEGAVDTRYIFCQTGNSFALASAYAAGPEGWTRVD